MAYTSQEPIFLSVTIDSGDLRLPTSTLTEGNILSSGLPYIHSVGTNNFFAGVNSGSLTITGLDDCGIGTGALGSITNGSANTAVGTNSLSTLSTGSGNTAIGCNAMTLASTANNNVAIGSDSSQNGALDLLVSGTNNIAIGPDAAHAYTGAESSNIVIGNLGVSSESNVIRIGTSGSGTGQQNQCFIAGAFGVTIVGSALLMNSSGQIGTVVSSRQFKENISYNVDSSAIFKLNPATFNLKTDKNKTKRSGLIAEEVHEIMPELVTYDDQNKPFSVQYHELPVLLLNEIKKLSKRMDALEKKIK